MDVKKERKKKKKKYKSFGALPAYTLHQNITKKKRNSYFNSIHKTLKKEYRIMLYICMLYSTLYNTEKNFMIL